MSANLGAIGVAIESEVGRSGGSRLHRRFLFSAQPTRHRPLVSDGFYDQAMTLRACQTENEQYCNPKIWSYNHVYTDDKSTQGDFAKAMVVDQKEGSNHRELSFVGSMKETKEMLELCKEKNLTSMIEIVKMDYINKTFERLEKNDVRYRFVVDVARSKLDQ